MRHHFGNDKKPGRHRYWLTVGAVAATVAGSAITAATATAATTSATSRPAVSSTQYAVGVPACAPQKRPGRATCDALIRHVVPAGTTGAEPFRVGTGAVRAGTIGPAGGLTPRDLTTAYSLATSGGNGQTVAIVDAYNDPEINSDLQTFDHHYGLAACGASNGCLRVVNQTGGTTPPTDDTTGWSTEESLDAEAVHSVCSKCKIILVEADSSGNVDLGTAENTAVRLGAKEVTNSFGEAEENSDSAFEASFNHPGVVVTASAGDDGYYSFDHLDQINQPSIPAAYNTTVSVGGTSLFLDRNGSRQSETVWNDNGIRDYFEQALERPIGAGGGGCSTMFSARKWQTSLSGWDSTDCGTKRLVSDVSAVADYLTGFDIYDSYNCGESCSTALGWFTIGGTSLSSPVIAAAYALSGGAHGVTYPALTLYGHRSQVYDVTAGGNGWCDGQGASECPNPNSFAFGVVDCAYTANGSVAVGDRACDALPGYDGPTGVGTPTGNATFAKTGPSAATTGLLAVTPGKSERWTATTTDPFPGGHVVRYVWNWGDGTSTVTTARSATHTYKSGGMTRTITLTLTDNYGSTGSTSRKVKIK